MLVDFCLPVKNEELVLRANVMKLLDYCRQADFDFSWRIVGVMNGSTDSSLKIFQELKKLLPTEIEYIDIPEPGRGGALKKYWSASEADILVYMDADLAVSLDDIPALIAPLLTGQSDLTIGSRLLSGALVERSWYRDLISHSYVFLSRLFLAHNLADLQCGFKAVRRAAFIEIKPFLQEDYWFFDTELIVLAQRFGYHVREIPVHWQENRYLGRSSTVKICHDSLIFLKNLWNFRRRLRILKKYRDNV